jgi:hypothetical protein
VTGYQIVTSPYARSNAITVAWAECPAGKRLLGGGFSKSDKDVVVSSSASLLNSGVWAWGVGLVTGSNSFATAYAICAFVS